MSFYSQLGLSLAFSVAFSAAAELGAFAISGTPVQMPVQTLAQTPVQTLAQTPAQTLAQTPAQTPVQPQTQTFSDVNRDYWAYDYIEALAKFNVISGFPDGSFQPNATVTRAQFASILRQAFLPTQNVTARPFVDVPANYWATQEIYAARAAGFLSGYPGNRFEPDSPIRRDEAIVSLTTGLKYSGGNPDALADYEDASAIPNYARPGIMAAIQANLVVNYPNANQFTPQTFASRAEVAAFVYQALVKEGRAEPLSIPSESWQTQPVTTLPTAAEEMHFSRTGEQIVTLAPGGSRIQLWNAQTGTLLKEIAAPTNRVFNAVALSADGKRVAAIAQSSPTNTVNLILWTADTGTQLWQQPLGNAQQPLAEGRLRSLQVAFSPDGTQLMSQVNLDILDGGTPAVGQLKLHSASTGAVVQSLDYAADGDAFLRSFAFSPDGQFLATASGLAVSPQRSFAEDHANLWRLNSNNQFYNYMTIQLVESDFSFRDMTITNSGLLNIFTQSLIETRLDSWSFQTGGLLGRTPLPDADRTDIFTRLSPDGKHYFVRSDVAGSRLGNAQGGTAQTIDGYVDTAAAFSVNGDLLAIANSQTVRIFSKATP